MKKFCLGLITTCFLLLGCASLQGHTTLPNFTAEKISDYEIKITWTGDAKYLYLKLPLNIKTRNKEVYNGFENSKLLEFVSNVEKCMSVRIGTEEYHFNYDNFDIFDAGSSDNNFVNVGFELKNANGEKLKLFGNNELRIISQNRLSYDNIVIGTGLHYGSNYYGTSKIFSLSYNDCYLALNNFSFDLRTDEEIKRDKKIADDKKELERLNKLWSDGITNPVTCIQTVGFTVGDYYYQFGFLVEMDESYENSKYMWENPYQFLGMVCYDFGYKSGFYLENHYHGTHMRNAVRWLFDYYIPYDQKKYTKEEFEIFLTKEFGYFTGTGYQHPFIYHDIDKGPYIYNQMERGIYLSAKIGTVTRKPYKIEHIDFANSWKILRE